MSNDTRFYTLVTYAKTGRMRFLSHLEIASVFDRAVRRARIPVEYSKGYTPRARIQFPMPLPVGAEGIKELCAIELAEYCDPTELLAALKPQLPMLPVSDLQVLERGSKSPFTKLEAASYRAVAEFADSVSYERLVSAVEAIVERSELVINRETKSRVRKIDIRPHVYRLCAEKENAGLQMCLGFTQQTLVKPDEVLKVVASHLGCSDESGWDRMIRTGLHFKRPNFDNKQHAVCD
ncbi:MAG: TIGR03936 family radical SAM-associated protein [Armatimonadota bacterium]